MTIKCDAKCSKKLPCGCICKSSCSAQPCPPCSVKKTITFPVCGHTVAYNCGTLPPRECTHTCDHLLDCGHECKAICQECKGGKHLDCKAKCTRELQCGHKCQSLCSEPCWLKPCAYKCAHVCSHYSSCREKCGDLCVQCLEPCQWRCKHHQCTKLCHEMCDRSVCNKRCKEKLKCGHKCRGVCGERCPPCPECEISEDTIDIFSQILIHELDKNDLIYQLQDCKCIFTLDGLDHYMFISITDEHGHAAITPKKCPSCKTIIRNSFRYGNIIKPYLVNIEGLKMKLDKERKKYNLEKNAEFRKQIVAAIGIGPGHWFTCPNGHPYVIGECGGAMVVSKCPDCGVNVGGTSHALLPNNAQSDYAGVGAPAWPTVMMHQNR